MDKKGISQVVVFMIVAAVVAVVLIYSLRVIPKELARQQTCEAHAGFCHDERTCPRGTQRIDYDCADNRPCCIGVEEEREDEQRSLAAAAQAEDGRPADEALEWHARRRITEIQERLTAAREEGDLARISAEYDAAKDLIVSRFAQYRPPVSRPMTPQTTLFDYNTVKSFEQLTLAAEAAFRIANEEQKRYASSQNYFNWMCKNWLLLTRAHLLGYYDESTYGLDNWLQNKERVFREYSPYIGAHSPACDAIRPLSRSTDFSMCKELFADVSIRALALAQETPTGEVWGSCLEFRRIVEPSPAVDFERSDFSVEGAGLFYPESLQEIFRADAP